jgi:DNA-binding winged helix-turn-helix (wHTH) protein
MSCFRACSWNLDRELVACIHVIVRRSIIGVFVGKLRKKLAAAGGKNFIETVWGRGYVLRENAANDDLRDSA